MQKVFHSLSLICISVTLPTLFLRYSPHFFQQPWPLYGTSVQTNTDTGTTQPSRSSLQSGSVQAEQIIQLQPGKNMVSFTVNPEDKSVSSIFPELVVVYRYDRKQGYIPVQTINPGEGYFVLSEQDQHVSVMGPPVIKRTFDLDSGEWKLIGGVFRKEDFSEPKDNPNGSVQDKAWTLEQGDYSAKQTLDPGIAYWINAEQEGQLTVGRDNTPGEISNISIAGTGVSDTTRINYIWTDKENDPDMSIVEWRQNDIPIASGDTLLPEEKQEGYPLEARVLSFDGIEYGELHKKSFDLEAADVVPPQVISSNLSEAYNPLEDILLNISEKLDPTTVNTDHIKLSQSGQEIPIEVQLEQEQGNQIRIISEEMPYGSDLKLTIDKEVKDPAGNQFDGDKDGLGGDDYVREFKTRAAPDNIPPKVLSNNLGQSVGIDSTLRFSFNERMAENTINNSTLKVLLDGQQISGMISYDDSTKHAIFQPDNPLDYGTEGPAILTKDIKDVAGNPLDGDGDGTGGDDYSASFQTEQQTDFPPEWSHIPDQETPEDNSLTLDLKNYLSDENMDEVQLQAEGQENLQVQLDNKVATITPLLNWYGTEEITFTATDSKYSSQGKAKITVNPVNDAPVADFTSPDTVEQYKFYNVDGNASKDVEDPKSVLEVSWNPGFGWWSDWTSKKTTSLYAGSQPGKKTIRMKVRDTEGVVSQTSKQITVIEDTTPPKVVATNAKDGFPINNRIEVDISESVYAGDLFTNFEFKKADGTDVEGSLVYNTRKNKLIFTPDIYLQQGESYQAIIRKEAADLADNQFDGNGDGKGGDDYVNTFTTGMVQDSTPPKIVDSNLSNQFPIDEAIRLYLEEDEILRPETILDNIFIKKGERDINHSVNYDDIAKEITIRPVESLEPFTDYQAIIKKDVLDLADNQFDGNGDGIGGDDYVGNFRTGAPPDTVPPKVIADNLSNSFNVWNNIELTLDEAVVDSLVNSDNVRLERLGDGVQLYGAVSWDSSNNKIVFDPDQKQSYSTDMKVIVKPNITDLEGNPLDGDGDGTGGDAYEKQFRTQDKPSSSPTAQLSLDPKQGLAPLPVDATVSGDDAEDSQSDLDAKVEWGDGYSTGWKSLEALMSISHTYNAAGEYTAILKVRDTDDKIGTDTRAVNVSQPDLNPPFVSGTNASNNFYVGGDVTFTFNEPMKESSIEVIFKMDGLNVVLSQSYDGGSKTLTLDPNSNLDFNSNCTITIKGDAEDLSGNKLDGNKDGIGGDDYVITFTTQGEPNDPPNSDFELDPVSGNAPLTSNAQITATDNQDHLNNLLKKFDWGDGTVTNWFTSNSAAHTFNTPGSYTVTLYVKDTGGLEDSTPKKTTVTVQEPAAVYTLEGQITALLEGGAVSGLTARAGGKSDVTDGSGQYSLSLPEGTYTLNIEGPGYHTRTVTGVTVNANKTINESVTSHNLDMEEFDKVFRSRGRLQKVTSEIPYYFVTKTLDNGEEVLEEWKDEARSAIEASKALGLPVSNTIGEGENPPSSGYFIVYWDPSKSCSVHGEHLSGDRIIGGGVTLKPGSGVLQEFCQILGGRGMGTKPGVFTGGKYISQHDKLMGKLAKERNLGNKSPDIN